MWSKKSILLLPTIFFLFVPTVLSVSNPIKFSDFERKNVHQINQLLDSPLSFAFKDQWDSRVDRYFFYSMALSKMKDPFTRK